MTEQQLTHRLFNTPDGRELINHWKNADFENGAKTIEELWSNQGRKKFIIHIIDQVKLEERKCKKLQNQ